MNPKKFLTIGGIILITIGSLGLIGLLGRISSASVFNPPYWINWFHFFGGILVLVVAFTHSVKMQTAVTFFATIVGTTIGLLGLLLGSFAASYFNMPELADPSDHIAHFAVGLFALWAWRNRTK